MEFVLRSSAETPGESQQPSPANSAPRDFVEREGVGGPSIPPNAVPDDMADVTRVLSAYGVERDTRRKAPRCESATEDDRPRGVGPSGVGGSPRKKWWS